MNPVDLKNAEDLLLIAVELSYEAKLFDWSVFNPVNFSMITMLEYGKKYFENSERIANWLIKLYTKLGMISLVEKSFEKFKFKERKDDVNYERLGSMKLSIYQDFGLHNQIEDVMSEYKDFYRDRVN